MSKFLGITFADQNVQPSDDAAIRRAALSDGFLYGCELSYAGSTLTMAAGQILACGRQFEHPTSDNWAVVDATSGYARLLLTIDLSRTSTEDNFDQITDVIEYATSADGFPELEQENVNASGLRYQIVVCVVSLGTGGITGIVEQLKTCYAPPAYDLTWEIGSATTSIANSDLPLVSGKYPNFQVDFKYAPSIIVRQGRAAYASTCEVGGTKASDGTYSNTSVMFYSRKFDFTNTKETGVVKVESCLNTYYNSGGSGWLTKTRTQNGSLLPVRIWGIKGEM